MRVAVTTPPGAPPDGEARVLRFVVGASSMTVWRDAGRARGRPRRRRCAGTSPAPTERALVFGRDAQGNPQVRAHAGDGGAFDLDVPPSVVEWYAAIDPGPLERARVLRPGDAARPAPRRVAGRRSPRRPSSTPTRASRSPRASSSTASTAPSTPASAPTTAPPGAGPDHRRPPRRRDDAAPVGPLPRRRDQGHRVEHRRQGRRHRPGRVDRGRARAASRRAHAGVLGCDLHVHARPSFDSPVDPRGPRPLAGRRRDRLRRPDRAQHRRRLLVGHRDARPARRAPQRPRGRGHDLQQGLRPLRRLPVPAGRSRCRPSSTRT